MGVGVRLTEDEVRSAIVGVRIAGDIYAPRARPKLVVLGIYPDSVLLRLLIDKGFDNRNPRLWFAEIQAVFPTARLALPGESPRYSLHHGAHFWISGADIALLSLMDHQMPWREIVEKCRVRSYLEARVIAARGDVSPLVEEL